MFEIRNKKKNINKLFLHKITDVSKMYETTRILLVPSIVDETFCRVAAEGKYYGLTILYNSTGNLKYSFSDYKNSHGFKMNYSIINETNLMYTSSDDFEKWDKKITEMYAINPNKSKLIRNNNINIKLLEKNILDLLSKAIHKQSQKTIPKPHIGLFGPFYSQGLGIQLREYYYFLKEKGFNVAAFSHLPFESCISSSNERSEWQLENIYKSNHTRDHPQLQEIIEFLVNYNIKCLIIPEICFPYIYKTIKFCKLLDVKIIGIINIETLRMNEIQTLISDLDIIACNNVSTFKILQAFIPKEKLKILLFDNVYFPKYYPPKIKDITKVNIRNIWRIELFY